MAYYGQTEGQTSQPSYILHTFTFTGADAKKPHQSMDVLLQLSVISSCTDADIAKRDS